MNHLRNNKPFWAIFGTQFLGAFNDNFFRTALITLITFHLATYSEMEKSLFVSAVFGLFMLPFFVFSPLAGQLADGYDKSKIIRIVKGAEVCIVSLSAYGFIYNDPYFLLSTLFCMGAHSAFFAPAKYGILLDILPQEKLLSGNGYIEAGTFLAIMLGTLFGALMIHLEISLFLLSLQLLIVALLGFLISWQIPEAPSKAPWIKLRFSWIGEMKQLFRLTHKDDRVFKAIIGISWFWLVGTVLLAQLPPLTQSVLKVEESVFILLLLLFTIGVGLGSILCNWFFKGEITTKYVPFLALLMAPFLFDIASFKSPLALTPTSLSSFLTSFKGLRFAADIFFLSFLGGLYIVPLYTFIQTHVSPTRCSQTIAFNNIINAGFMVFVSFVSFYLLSLGVSIPTLIVSTALGQIGITFYVIRLLPDVTLKKCLYWTLRLLFRLEVKGLEHFENAGEKVILIANHVSYIDALMIAAALPEEPFFAINLFIAQKWWIKPFLIFVKVFPVDTQNPYALREVIEEIKKNHKVLIFPEGRLTITGSLMKIYEGSGMVAEKTHARILPLRIDGTQYTFFSHLKGQATRRFFPKITLTLLPSQSLAVDPILVGKARRHALSEQLYDMMTRMVFATSPLNATLFSSLLESQKHYGSSRPILEDESRKVLTYRGLLKSVFTLSHRMCRLLKTDKTVGLLLPNTHGLVVSFWALQASGRVPALLNYTSGSPALLAACQLANIKHVFTSRSFIEKAHLSDVIALLKHHKIHVYYLESEVKKLSVRDKLWGFYGLLFPERAYKAKVRAPNPQEEGVLLFTSGSEGAPKAVVLSHLNLQANRYQLASVVDFNGKDRVLNVLPLFHAFGLTAGMILPLLSGIKTLHCISPLHYRIIVELVYDTNATILFGTDTFLFGYGRAAHVYDFHTLRYVFAGAEKLKKETCELWFMKFGIRLFEGYGTTETSPVLCVNTAMRYKQGTVGRFLPGIMHKLERTEGIKKGGRLWVKGPNVMKGYFSAVSPKTLISPQEGWYDTGDIVEVDGEGYVRLIGRAKRFAKVAGEMISLLAVEEAIERLWPEHRHAVLSCPDSKKGETLILFTTFPPANRTALIAFWRAQGLSELSLPKVIHILPSLPLLGSGKVNYRELAKYVS